MPPLASIDTLDALYDDLTRRRFLAGATAAGLLTACSSTPSTGSGPPASDDGFPVTITHKLGSTVITGEPKRVVTVGVNEQDFMLALGVVPLAITRFREARYPGEIYPWAQDELGGAAPPQALDYAADGYQLEEVARLRPDLILGLYSPMSQEDYDTFAKIAPTVAQPVEYPDFGVPWHEMARIIGRIFGKAERAEEAIAGVEARFAQVRAEHPELVGKTALMAFPSFDDSTYFLYGPDDTRARILYQLGFVPPAGLAEIAGDEFGGHVSMETPGILDVAALVWLAEPADRAKLYEDPLYSRLAVKTKGREIFLGEPVYDLSIVMGGFITVLSLPFLLDELVPMLAAAVDGDPATAPTP